VTVTANVHPASSRVRRVSCVSEIVERAYSVYIENVAFDPPHQGAGAGQYFITRRPTRASSEPELRLYSNGQ
jgi:hypothetical protein